MDVEDLSLLKATLTFSPRLCFLIETLNISRERVAPCAGLRGLAAAA
jgi:hypothetical protein